MTTYSIHRVENVFNILRNPKYYQIHEICSKIAYNFKPPKYVQYNIVYRLVGHKTQLGIN